MFSYLLIYTGFIYMQSNLSLIRVSILSIHPPSCQRLQLLSERVVEWTQECLATASSYIHTLQTVVYT